MGASLHPPAADHELPDHPTYLLRPADPRTVTFGFYAPSMTFCYPGGEGPLGS